MTYGLIKLVWPFVSIARITETVSKAPVYGSEHQTVRIKLLPEHIGL